MPVEGRPINTTVPRSEINGLVAGVWSPLNRQSASGTFGPSGGAFGAQYVWGPHTYASATSSSVPYTEWIEVALEQPVYIFRVNIGQPRYA